MISSECYSRRGEKRALISDTLIIHLYSICRLGINTGVLFPEILEWGCGWTRDWKTCLPMHVDPGTSPDIGCRRASCPQPSFRFEVEEKLPLVSVIAESLRVACVRNCIDDPRDDALQVSPLRGRDRPDARVNLPIVPRRYGASNSTRSRLRSHRFGPWCESDDR